jgi:hypothetical protein
MMHNIQGLDQVAQLDNPKDRILVIFQDLGRNQVRQMLQPHPHDRTIQFRSAATIGSPRLQLSILSLIGKLSKEDSRIGPLVLQDTRPLEARVSLKEEMDLTQPKSNSRNMGLTE